MLWNTGCAAGSFIVGVLATNYFTNKDAQASRGTSKVCTFKMPLTKRACGKPLYYRERTLDQNGKTIEIFTCDAGHEYTQQIISH